MQEKMLSKDFLEIAKEATVGKNGRVVLSGAAEKKLIKAIDGQDKKQKAMVAARNSLEEKQRAGRLIESLVDFLDSIDCLSRDFKDFKISVVMIERACKDDEITRIKIVFHKIKPPIISKVGLFFFFIHPARDALVI